MINECSAGAPFNTYTGLFYYQWHLYEEFASMMPTFLEQLQFMSPATIIIQVGFKVLTEMSIKSIIIWDQCYVAGYTSPLTFHRNGLLLSSRSKGMPSKNWQPWHYISNDITLQ
jgi:hypothetical protein